MDRIDFLILIFFLISILYVVSRAINDLDSQTKIDYDKGSFTQQLGEFKLGATPLQDILDINFRFDKRYRFSEDKAQDKQPRMLNMTVNNKSSDTVVYLDWNESNIVTDFNDSSRRLIRLDPDNQLRSTVFPPMLQQPNVVDPKTSFGVAITAENLLKADSDDKPTCLKPNAPILDLNALNALATRKKPPPPPKAKKLNSQFRLKDTQLEFYVKLQVRLFHLDTQEKGTYRLTCRFTVTNMPWYDHVPWNPK